LLITGLVAGAAPPAYSIPWWSVSSGGSCHGGDFSISSTIGQAVVGPASGGDYFICAGFQCVASREYRLYVPMAGKRH